MRRMVFVLYSVLLVPLILCMFSINASALTYGLTEAVPGYEKTRVYYYLPQNYDTYMTYVEDREVGTNTSAQLSYDTDGIMCDLNAMPYSLHGIISTDQISGYNSNELFVVTSFSDQLYFETYNGEAAEIIFNFDLDLEIIPYTTDSYVYAGLGMQAITTDNESAYPFSQNYTESYHGTVTISTLQDLYEGGLVLSASYFTFGIGISAAVNNATIDWSNSLNLNPDNPYFIYQYDEAGNRIQLLPGQFTLTSQNNNFPSTAPVPEPATLLLLGSGLFGFLGFRKKIKK